MDQSLQRVLLQRWLRGALVIGALLLMPSGFALLQRVFDPGAERREIARMIERQQRANGEIVITATGETRRAVVYTPAGSPEAFGPLWYASRVWWSRVLAVLAALSLLAETWRLLHRRQGAPPSRPAI
jgi:hypothetical protein